MEDLKYLELLSDQYKNTSSAITEMINLQAIISLPKGTEHFLSDIHGEFDAFNHILKNASGVIKMYIEEIYGQSLSEKDKNDLAILIYYPDERLDVVLQYEKDIDDYFKITLFRLIMVLKRSSVKYTRSKVRKALPKDYAYILEELIHEDLSNGDKFDYYSQIISSIVAMKCAREFIMAICSAIHRLVIDHLHIIGDIYDRGMYADKVMDLLCDHHSIDIQWGNHDILWIGASAGQKALICSVIRLCAKYNNLQILEDSYGINLVPLVTYALEMFKDDDCALFMPKKNDSEYTTKKEASIIAKVHKAITLLELKAESEVIKNHPEYKMDKRLLLDKINYENNTINIDDKVYDLLDVNFPTVDKENPYSMSDEEKAILDKLQYSFMNSDKLTKHIKLLLQKGSMYKIYNGNLLLHGCVPMTNEGEFADCNFLGKYYYGKELIDEIDKSVRIGYFETENKELRQKNIDIMWYLWCGALSPLYGKAKMAYFEQYFIEDKSAREEEKDPYYTFREDVKYVDKILENFGLTSSESKIINGHVPVRVKKGESPLKADGKVIVIDGGLARAYQKVTGIAGYTLISNSNGLVLASHEPFTSVKQISTEGVQIISNNTMVERYKERMLVKDTDNGKIIMKKIEELQQLLYAYRQGLVHEKI